MRYGHWTGMCSSYDGNKILILFSRSVMSTLLSRSQTTNGPSIRKALRILDGLQDNLRRLVATIDEGTVHVQHEGQAALMSTGICGLPDDILHLLFDYARLQQNTHSQKKYILPVEITLSHVCRQFRTKMLSSPTLWSNLCSWYPRSMLSTYYSRSKDARLTVRLSLSDLDYPYSWFFGMSDGHVKRWKELYIGSDAEVWSDKESGVLQKLATWLSTHTLSQLRVLFISCPPSSHDVYTDGNHDRRGQCYEKWRMPVLRRLELSNILPGINNAHDGTLTSFRLIIDNCMLLNQHNKGHIWSFLQSSPSLTHLTLSILSNFPNHSSISLGPVVLPHLRTLRLENRHGMSVEAFRNALTHIQAPALDCLHLETEFSFLRPPIGYAQWVAHVFPPLANFVSVSELTLLFKASHATKENVFPAEGFSHIFHALPRLRRLHFGCNSPHKMRVLDLEEFAGRLGPIMDCAGTDYGPLTRICWRNCAVSDLFLKALLETSMAHPFWSAFEALQFVEEGKMLTLPKAEVERLLASKIAVHEFMASTT